MSFEYKENQVRDIAFKGYYTWIQETTNNFYLTETTIETSWNYNIPGTRKMMHKTNSTEMNK